MPLTTDGVTAVLLGSAVLLTAVLFSRRRTARYPPGPAGWPIIGNLHLLPSDFHWTHISKVAKTYGDLVFYRGFGTHTLYVNDYEIVSDLLESRGSIYSDRPHSEFNKIMQLEMLGYDQFSSDWQLRRKIFHQQFNKGAVSKYVDGVSKGAHVYAARVLRDPSTWFAETRLLSTKRILEMTYGIKIDSPDDKYVQYVENMSRAIGLGAVPNTWAVDTFPFLKYLPSWFPGTHSVRVAKSWAQDVIDGQSKPWNYAVEHFKSSTHRPSFASEALSSAVASERLLRSVSAGMYVGGSETAVLTMHVFYMAMTLYPSVQKKAQEEIDRVVGTQRLPELEDRENLPYLDAILKETLRWYLIVPLALPHRSMRDDVYKGYFIPKGTLVIANSWGFSQDPDMYPSPEEFRPERFLEPRSDGTLPLDPIKYAFGYGRRICPGLEFAILSLWHSMASILSTMSISKAKDADGNDIVPSLKDVPGILRYVEPFECRIEPRLATSLGLLDDAIMLRA